MADQLVSHFHSYSKSIVTSKEQGFYCNNIKHLLQQRNTVDKTSSQTGKSVRKTSPATNYTHVIDVPALDQNAVKIICAVEAQNNIVTFFCQIHHRICFEI